MAEKCTKTSSPVWRLIKPKPLASLNHFTVPCSIVLPVSILNFCLEESLRMITGRDIFLKRLVGSIRERLKPCRSCQFNPPHRAAGIERAFHFDESRGVAGKDPHVRVWRLFSEERRYQSGYASDFYLHHVPCRFVFGVATGYRFL